MIFLFSKGNKYIEFIIKWKIYLIIGLVVLAMVVLSLFNHYEDNSKEDEFNKEINSKQVNSKRYSSTNKDNNERERQSQRGNNNEKIFIDIKGAVEHPNVYQMTNTERVIDAINKAKPYKDADLSQVNLSERLIDQKLIYVPKKGEHSQYNTVNNISNNNINQNEGNKQINLNNATETDLKSIPGVGPSKAREIINYREQNGGFKNIEDLKKIKGFGEKTFEKLKEHLVV